MHFFYRETQKKRNGFIIILKAIHNQTSFRTFAIKHIENDFLGL